MELRKIINKTIREYLNEQILNESMENNLIKKYHKVIFSPNFYKAEDNMVKYRTKLYLEKIDTFIKFYKKYRPKGIRVIDGIDFYEESKVIFDTEYNGSRLCAVPTNLHKT